MSGNIALGLADQVVSAHCEKGLMTLNNIKENQSAYDDETKLRTWILGGVSKSMLTLNEAIIDVKKG